ncbi:hypothetical protein [Kluyvera intermedia]
MMTCSLLINALYVNNFRFWHTTAKQEQGTYERNADLQLLSAFPLIGYIT